MPALRPAYLYSLVFLAAASLVWWLAGDRLILINDEGTFLSQAARIVRGEVLYKDIFGLTGPLSYWLLALVFNIFGVSLPAAHGILAVQVALLTTLIFFITRKLADTTSAAIAAFLFCALYASDAAIMTNNHRWDANTYAIAGIVAIWRARPLLGGFLLALSVWATPIFGITAAAATAAAWVIGQSPWRVMAGGAAGGALGLLAIFLSGGLPGFLGDLLWAKSNYSQANNIPYGGIVGGYSALFAGASSPGESLIRVFIVIGLTVPVWLPPLCGLLVLRHRDRNLIYFCICGASMIAGVSPRFDAGHLMFAAPLFYAIAGTFLQRARWTVLPIGAIAGVFLLSAVLHRSASEYVDTPVGLVRTDKDSAAIVRWLTANIKPGEPLFVYPYPPIAYFLTGGHNISRYCLLQPGLFTEADEKLAADEIRRRTPAKVLYMDIPPADILHIWPNTDPTRLQLHYLHNFVTANFQPAAKFGNFHLYTPPVTAAAHAP
jgi:hypothetical protein